jgi:hypothetical protein
MLCLNCGFAQTKKQFFDAYKAAGDSCLAERNYFGAHQALSKALEFVQNAEVAFNCAEACRKYQNYVDAEKYYRLTNSLDSVTFRLASFWIADLLKMQGKYADAAYAFDQFYMANRNYNDYFTVRAQQEAIINSSTVKNIPTQDIKQHRIDNSRINTMYSEYAPVQYNDSLFFYGAVQALDQRLADTSLVFSNYLTKISRSYVKDSLWSNPVVLDSLNDPEMFAGNLTFSGDGKRVYFTKCAAYDCAIYTAQFEVKKGQFSNTEKLPTRINKPGSSNTTPHLAVTPQGEVLFWSSDRTDGKGGWDIWYARINPANYSFENPRNCGTNINTPGDEITPFYDARDSLLFFSSEWHAGLGGFDVFASKVDMRNNKFAKVSNVGQPINSSYNDLYYSYSRDSLRAYWVSNRNESTKLLGIANANDIYYHTLQKKTISRISDLIPITLYFDNDFPNPRSRDSVTTDEYSRLFRNYMLQRNNFIFGFTQFSSMETFNRDVRMVEDFFAEARKEYANLELFTQLVNILCDDGLDIVIALKGYASPVGETEYNEILAKRRISCLMNYFNEYNNGALVKYTQNEPNTGKGSLTFLEKPIGSLTDEAILPYASEADRAALNDRTQRWKSVYSPVASSQRKIEIVAVDIAEKENLLNEIRSEIMVNKRPVEDELNNVRRQRARQQIPVSRDYNESPEYNLDEPVMFNNNGNGTSATPTSPAEPRMAKPQTETNVQIQEVEEKATTSQNANVQNSVFETRTTQTQVQQQSTQQGNKETKQTTVDYEDEYEIEEVQEVTTPAPASKTPAPAPEEDEYDEYDDN